MRADWKPLAHEPADTIPDVRRTVLIAASIAVALVAAMAVPMFVERAISDAEIRAQYSGGGADPASAGAGEEPERFGTAPGSNTPVCTTPSEDNNTPFEGARLSVTDDEAQVRFEFGDGSLFAPGVPNSVSYPRSERLVIAIGDTYTYVIISPSDEEATINYSIRDSPSGGERLPGALNVDDGDLVVALPRPVELTETDVRWRVEALGRVCPQADDADEQFLVTDAFAGD